MRKRKAKSALLNIEPSSFVHPSQTEVIGLYMKIKRRRRENDFKQHSKTRQLELSTYPDGSKAERSPLSVMVLKQTANLSLSTRLGSPRDPCSCSQGKV